MTNANKIESRPADREIAATRVYKAPRELVFKMWTDARHIGQWWGPRGFTTTTHEMDVKPGGVWRFVMHGPDGTDFPNRIEYREVVEPELLVYDHRGEAEFDKVRFTATVTFAETQDAGVATTTLSMRMVFETAAERNRVAEEFGAVEGLHETLERLEHFVAAHA